MADNVVTLFAKKAPSWSATIVIEPTGFGKTEARIVALSGDDGFEVSERCGAYAQALHDLADKLAATAIATREVAHD